MFGRQKLSFLHNCAKYSSSDKTLQYLQVIWGKGYISSTLIFVSDAFFHRNGDLGKD